MWQSQEGLFWSLEVFILKCPDPLFFSSDTARNLLLISVVKPLSFFFLPIIMSYLANFSQSQSCLSGQNMYYF